MATSVRVALERWAIRRVAAGALAGVVACVAGLVWRHHRLGGLDLLDSRGWCTPGEAAALLDDLDRLDTSARLVYAGAGLTIDMLFPIVYGLLLATSGKNGTRIYHVPGGCYYDQTPINTSKGERWFCTENEARAAGWRRSRQ